MRERTEVPILPQATLIPDTHQYHCSVTELQLTRKRMVNVIAGKLMRNSNGNGFDDNNDDNDNDEIGDWKSNFDDSPITIQLHINVHGDEWLQMQE